MKTSFFTALILIFFSSLFANITNFVPPDYDFVILVDDPATNYSLLKGVPLFSFVLGESGLGMEYVFDTMLSDAEEKCKVKRDAFLESLSKDFLIASKGITMDLNSLTSLDLNYYIDVLKNLGANTILVVQSSSPTEFLDFLCSLLDVSIQKDGDVYIMKDEYVTLFAAVKDEYVVLSGSKSTAETSLSYYSSPGGGITEEASGVLSRNAFIKGYFKGDSFKIEMGVEVKENLKTDHFELVTRVENGKFVLRVDQFVEGDLEKPFEYIMSSEDMGEIPFMGNYFIGISARSSREAVEGITSWFSGKGGEVEKISEIVTTIVKGASGKIYIIGDISAASEVTFAAIFRESKDNKEAITKVLEKYGAVEKDGQFILNVGKGKVYFFWYAGRFVMSNVSKEEYSRYYERKKLLDDPTFNYLTSFIPYKEDISRAYLDMGNLMEKLTGIELKSKMLFFQTYERGKFIYIVEVM